MNVMHKIIYCLLRIIAIFGVNYKIITNLMISIVACTKSGDLTKCNNELMVLSVPFGWLFIARAIIQI